MADAIIETAGDLHRLGFMTDVEHKKITMRHLNRVERPEVAPIDGADIRRVREDAHLSQAVFAHHLKLTVGYVSQLERGTKHATGPALVLLDLIRRKGFEAIL